MKAIANALGAAIDRKTAEERVAHVAQFDAVTGLPNRTLFRDRLTQAIARAEAQTHAAGRRVLRPRSLQGDQRHARPSCRRPPAAIDRQAAAGCPARG